MMTKEDFEALVTKFIETQFDDKCSYRVHGIHEYLDNGGRRHFEVIYSRNKADEETKDGSKVS